MTINASPLRHAGHVLRHFASTRYAEVLALQASPLLGCWLSGVDFQSNSVFPLALLLLGSLALTAHVFVFNDWANYYSDQHDPRRASIHLGERVIRRRDVARLATALLLISMAAFAMVGDRALFFGAAIAGLSFLYSRSTSFGKGTPIAASLNHVFGGTLHFLLGYTLIRLFDARGVAIGLFFGLVFAAGHLNQEIRDYEADRLNGIRTSAVVFGCRRAFLASFALFSAAYGLIVGLVMLGMLPRLLFLAAGLWVLQCVWSRRALHRGLGYETALWMQRRYRAAFALVGLALLAG